jgi:hypothetical protein
VYQATGGLNAITTIHALKVETKCIKALWQQVDIIIATMEILY